MNLRKIDLTPEQAGCLQDGYKNGKTATYRKRCHIILLKSSGRTSKDVGSIVGLSEISVNSWLNRYEAEGIEGLLTKTGRGAKRKLSESQDAKKVREVVKKERQRLKVAKEELERELGKTFSLRTLKRFLKNLTADGNE